MRASFAAVAWLGLCLGPALAYAETRVEVLETDPGTPATLGKWEQLYVRVGYKTDQPMYVRGTAYFDGKPAPSMTSGSMRNETGGGEAFFWFAYTTLARVDVISITAHDAKTNKVLAQTAVSVDLTWSGEPVGATRPRPEWVLRMQAEQNRRVKAATEVYMNRPVPLWESALFFTLVWSIPGYVVMQGMTLYRWSGGWRLVAAVPAVPMAAVLVHTMIAYRAGSNLFPLVLIFTAPMALLYLAVLLMIRRARRRPATP